MKQFVCFITCCIAVNVYGQQLSMQIVNTWGKPIEDVNIRSKQSGFHTHTDKNGTFVIESLSTDTLVVSHLGYVTRYISHIELQSLKQIRLSEIPFSIDQIQLSQQANVLGIITQIDMQSTPIQTSQDVLRQVPGLFIGQHAGGGKAEQIFLRGFDIDHGTDINIQVDGMPVNMVSHAHGQGYADLHFVIPETVDKVEFEKGAYEAEYGNFATAGRVHFKTKNTLSNSLVKLEQGQYNHQRMLTMVNLLKHKNQSMYLASEYLTTDGPFESSQHFDRKNLMLKFHNRFNSNHTLSVSASYFDSKWDASGQIPQRAIDRGLIGRFGAIDDTEGGKTKRTNLIANWTHILDTTTTIHFNSYISKYDFQLFSNFTFFKDNSKDGDQIMQQEERTLTGLHMDYTKTWSWMNLQAGVQYRNDKVGDNQLLKTKNRTHRLDTLTLGDITETNSALYVNTQWVWNDLTIDLGVRYDHFVHQFYDKTATLYDTRETKQDILSPKIGLSYAPNSQIKLYIKTGKGFHSNDSRTLLKPSKQEIKTVLPASYGADLGIGVKILPELYIQLAYWYMELEQEFVYVGDAAITEPSGKTRRQGVDLSLRYQPVSWLFLNYDINYTYAKAVDEPVGKDDIPLAAPWTSKANVYIKMDQGWRAGIEWRAIADRPANEDNSIIAKGYHILDTQFGYSWGAWSLDMSIQNLLDTAWNEAQFATESRLKNEPKTVNELHFTPGMPRFFKVSLGYIF